MNQPKKIIEKNQKTVEEVPVILILKVMDRNTKRIIKIDGNKEKDWKTKYLHASGKEFN